MKVLEKLKGFTWKQWVVLGALALVLGFTGWRVFHTVRAAAYWRSHRDEPIRGWMSLGYVAHSYHVPPHILYESLGLSFKQKDKRPLRQIARAQNRSLNEVSALLHNAIVHARPPYPPPEPLPRDSEGPR